MKAVFFERHGGPEVVRFGDRPTPEWTGNQVLIEVHAAAVNPRDWQFRDGTYAFRHLSGRLPIIPGSDVSGVVVQRGAWVRDLEVGDEVFAMQTTFGRMGGFAEYIAVDSRVVARKPSAISHRDAAAVPVAGLTAWQAMHNSSNVRAGTKIVVIGASGGVGHYAVQIARHAGAVVTGVCGPGNVDFVRDLGADHVIDYTQTRFTDVVRHQDIVFDTIGRENLSSCAAVLDARGRYLTTNPTAQAAAEWATTTLTHRVFGGRRSRLVLVRPKRTDLNAIAALMSTGHIRSMVEDTYPLEDAGDALQKSRSGRTRGKLVLQIR